MLAPGSILEGRYKIERTLGSGGMGAVYLASDTRLPRQWAIKEMSDSFEDAEDRAFAEESFSAEAAILSAINHPNLPRIVDFFKNQGRHYLVMDYIEGQTLESKIKQGPLAIDKALDLAKQLATVLQFLHEQPKPIIFRDLKPANIIIGPDGTAKLIDFGIARVLRPGASSDTRALGTPGYAAPEQYGRGQSDARTDIYALGATLHHALTGKDPSESPFQFQSVRQLRPEVPEALEHGVMRSLSLKPDERFQTAGDLLSALEGLKQDPEVFKLLPPSLKTSQLPPAPPQGFQPGSIFVGKLAHAQRAKGQAILHGDIRGRLKSSAAWLKPVQGKLQAKDPLVEFSVDTASLGDGGRHVAELSLEGEPHVAALKVEIDVLPRKLPAWAYPVAFLLTCLSLVPLVGLLGVFGLMMMLMGAPRRQRGGIRFMFWLSALAGLGWVSFLAVTLGIYNNWGILQGWFQ